MRLLGILRIAYYEINTPVATGYTKIKIFSVHFSTLSTLNVCHRRKFLSYQTGLNYPWKDKHINLIKRVNIDNEVAQYLGNVNWFLDISLFDNEEIMTHASKTFDGIVSKEVPIWIVYLFLFNCIGYSLSQLHNEKAKTNRRLSENG